MSINPLFDLSGKTALITGASRGIGASIAELLAAAGARVIISSRRAEACDEVAQGIIDAGGQAMTQAAHIGDPQAVESMFSALDECGWTPDILVNNAAANPYFGPLLDMPLSAYEKTAEVNIRGYTWMSIQGGRRMRERGGGCIVNVASVNGVRPAPMQAVYSMSKAAVISLTQVMARECASDGIRVNAVLPGLTDTKFASALTQNPAILKQVLSVVPQARVAQPDEISPAVLYLVSPAASYVTGTTLAVDGGYLA